ncbi:nucleoside hydrolase [Pseudomarimonas arenosa]|uniref:Nucleoside hydrolase n=1 Tax=Pseudomarimonas arenosa TaxID=2774145 RepID=A0AAW3ZFU4_9GAMM|nr:nucleoside hydrolase [Pseudomarimonas arenosa]MBD8525015.1 nucleoside hydrolase [Pseudomarimonas arenosa]
MSERIPLLIDTDPGVDDALAILMALASEQHEVLGLCIAAGNVGLEHTCRNALCLLDVAQREVPVFAGCDRPLLHPAADAAFVHGNDGFGDVSLPTPARSVEAEHAALAILRFSHEHAGRLHLVTLGPLTNLALALRLDPSLPSRIDRLTVMGGAVTGRGNTSLPAEFNIGFDPEAAHIVMSGFGHFDLIDWEATLAHPISFEAIDAYLGRPGELPRFYQAISAKTRRWIAGCASAWHAADGLAMAVALEPDGCLEVESCWVGVETEGRQYRGATLVDWQRRGGQPANARILRRYDAQRFERLIRKALAIAD